MTDAIKVLFSYAREWLEKPLLVAEPEYEDVKRRANSQEQRLRAALNDEEEQILDNLVDERNTLSALHGEAMFRAGFQLALELGRF